MARTFSELFVNRRACTIQSTRPHPESSRHYYYRAKGQNGAPAPGLTFDTLRRHLSGELTVGIYAINPATQRSKWTAIDADYRTALEDLIKVQRQLRDDGVAAYVLHRELHEERLSANVARTSMAESCNGE